MSTSADMHLESGTCMVWKETELLYLPWYRYLKLLHVKIKKKIANRKPTQLRSLRLSVLTTFQLDKIQSCFGADGTTNTLLGLKWF